MAPGAPTGLSFEIGRFGARSVTLTWTAPTSGDPPTTYVIQAGSAPGASNLWNAETGSTDPYQTVARVQPGTYYVRVLARNDCGTTGPTNEVTIVVR